jgi:peptidoglycan hydrolase CwlO-like protein
MMVGLLTTLLCSAFQAHAALLSTRGKVGADVTPVEKVIQMVEELQAKVSAEGKAEAATYDKFACFCKSKTDEKVKAIAEEEQTVKDLQAEITSLSADRDSLDQNIQDLTKEIADYEADIKEAAEIRAEEKATFEAALADVIKSVTQLEKAVETLKASALLQGKSSSSTLAHVQGMMKTAVNMADAMGLVEQNSGLYAFMQQPVMDVPVADYSFHAGDIVGTVEKLLKAFRDKKVELETTEAKAVSDFERGQQSRKAMLKAARESLDEKNKERTVTTEAIATAQGDMTNMNAVLNDDRTYLKDLTIKCELKAKQWDQRSSMRSAELSAITQALTVLQGSVATQAGKVGEGGRSAMLQSDAQEDDDLQVSFVQKAAVAKTALRLVKKAGVVPSKSDEDMIRSKLISIFRDAGKKFKSPVLSTLALKVAEDPFVKIKGMIQDMIEKLLEEEADEANHKGWCDEEISKTVKDRDYRLKDIEDLHASLEELNAREEKLTLEKTELEEQVATLNSDYANQTKARAEEKAENEETVSEAKVGVSAIKQALEILSHFYGEAAQATVEEGLIQQPSVEDDAPDAGFDGAYTGAQGSSTGIVGMMEVILGDFERTISDTEELEASQKKEFVDYERETQVSISTKSAALSATSDDLTSTTETIAAEFKEIKTQQGLFDTATKTWEELLPGCVADPGMSYEERVERRETEIQALKDAYCILDNKDAGCDGVF